MTTILLVLDPDTLTEAQVAQVAETAPDMRLLVTRDYDKIEDALDDIEIAACNFPRQLLPRAHSLRWFQQFGAGADWLLRHPEACELDFVLTNASGVHAISVSEHILAFLLAFARQLHVSIRAQEHHEWRRFQREELFELAGKRMVLIGVGAIGTRTAQVATVLGMRVLGVRRNPAIAARGVEAMFGSHQLLDLLPDADFVVLTVPLTNETKGMVGEREFRAMKPTAYVVNTGRGGTIQEGALIRALQERWIAGAGLDVFETEPLPANSPLWEMENVILTPHCGWMTPHCHRRAMDIFLDNLDRYRSGQPLRNVVDKRLGY